MFQFPFSPSAPAERTVRDLWPGRKLATKMAGGEWRTGTVSHWTQFNAGPMADSTRWKLSVLLDPLPAGAQLAPGDVVEIHSLAGAKQHNGHRGEIRAFIEEKGRFRVHYSEGNGSTTIAVNVKPDNLRRVTTLESDVRRMNVDGGGTLLRFGPGSQPLISLEWREPAIPQLDLNAGSSYANCPVCRAVEPPRAGYVPADAPTEPGECPICIESAECMRLHCKHQICKPCWVNWCRASAGHGASEDPEPAVLDAAIRNVGRFPRARGANALGRMVLESCHKPVPGWSRSRFGSAAAFPPDTHGYAASDLTALPFPRDQQARNRSDGGLCRGGGATAAVHSKAM